MPLLVREQGLRFLRLFVAALVTQAVALDLTHIGRSAIVAAIVGAAEVAYRQWRPTVPTKVVAAPLPKQAGIGALELIAVVFVILVILLLLHRI